MDFGLASPAPGSTTVMPLAGITNLPWLTTSEGTVEAP
jgi:hypothetical protein